ncbi:hypothetical protein EON65_03160 [archaeon]|nr:MAG: hypothetical protein EON65_03160 [archaeon]
MGTHPSGPAKIMGSDATLASWLSDKPDLVGKVPEGYVNNDLPFLFKILSIRTALSIQVNINIHAYIHSVSLFYLFILI